MVNYYAKFISNYSAITHPLNEVLKDGVKWKWSKDQQRAFKQQKDKKWRMKLVQTEKEALRIIFGIKKFPNTCVEGNFC